MQPLRERASGLLLINFGVSILLPDTARLSPVEGPLLDDMVWPTFTYRKLAKPLVYLSTASVAAIQACIYRQGRRLYIEHARLASVPTFFHRVLPNHYPSRQYLQLAAELREGSSELALVWAE